MILTRKIQVYINETDKEKNKEFLHTVYRWRDLVRKAANIVVSHKFVQQSVHDFVYLKDDIKEKFYVKDILKEGKGMSEQNVTYRVLSDMLKGKMPADIYTCLNQAIASAFKKTITDVIKGETTIRSYKNNIPMPFSGAHLKSSLKIDADGRYVFKFGTIPMAMAFGRDRSNNQIIVDRCMRGEYKVCTSSIMISEKKDPKTGKTDRKMFLLFCFDQPQQEYTPVEGKALHAFLGIANPITYMVDIKAKNGFDSGDHVFTIGTAEEFFHRRRQIQEAVRRCQLANKYNKGGHGRKKKCKALDRWHDREENYVTTKIHTYSRMLVDAAMRYKCSRIVLMKQQEREQEAKEDELVLRNWSYSGLKEKIMYKCQAVGIEVVEE